MNRLRTIRPTLRTATAAAMTLGAALVLTACGDGYGSTTESQAGGGGNAAAESGADLAVNEASPLGPVVVDSEGFTLYRFDNDTKEPPTTNCAADCLVKWPAAVAPDDIELDGIDGIVGTLTRDDGTEQVTLDGWALYRFAADAKPGDTSGHGVGEVWWAVTPDGEKAKAVSSSSGGYDY